MRMALMPIFSDEIGISREIYVALKANVLTTASQCISWGILLLL